MEVEVTLYAGDWPESIEALVGPLVNELSVEVSGAWRREVHATPHTAPEPGGWEEIMIEDATLYDESGWGLPLDDEVYARLGATLLAWDKFDALAEAALTEHSRRMSE